MNEKAKGITVNVGLIGALVLVANFIMTHMYGPIMDEIKEIRKTGEVQAQQIVRLQEEVKALKK